MPTYEYLCQDCGAAFETKASISEYSRGLKPDCPECGSQRAIRRFTPITVATGSRTLDSAPGGCSPACGPGCCG